MRVLTIGTFDLFHVGHVRLLYRCHLLAGEGGTVIVGVNDSEFVEAFKGRAPILDNASRLEMVKSCRTVDDAFIHYGRDFAAQDILRVLPDIIAVGDDWRGRDYLGQLGVTQGWLDARGIRVAYLPRTAGVSSTDLRARLRD